VRSTRPSTRRNVGFSVGKTGPGGPFYLPRDDSDSTLESSVLIKPPCRCVSVPAPGWALSTLFAITSEGTESARLFYLRRKRFVGRYLLLSRHTKPVLLSRRFRIVDNSVLFRRCAEIQYPSLKFLSQYWIGTRQCPSRRLNFNRTANPCSQR
jgi:hypothetical protein